MILKVMKISNIKITVVVNPINAGLETTNCCTKMKVPHNAAANSGFSSDEDMKDDKQTPLHQHSGKPIVMVKYALEICHA